LLAGHNHGGQVRFPVIAHCFVPSRYGRRYDCGIFHETATLLHVSRGLGGEHPLRYNCRPESGEAGAPPLLTACGSARRHPAARAHHLGYGKAARIAVIATACRAGSPSMVSSKASALAASCTAFCARAAEEKAVAPTDRNLPGSGVYSFVQCLADVFHVRLGRIVVAQADEWVDIIAWWQRESPAKERVAAFSNSA